MRCPDCQKFTGLETQEPDVQDPEVENSTATLTLDVRLVRTCADCGTELKETTFNFELKPIKYMTRSKDGVREDWVEGLDEGCTDDNEHDFQDLEVEAELTERAEGKGRFTTSYYGVRVEITGQCSHCGLQAIWEGADDCKASAFEELG